MAAVSFIGGGNRRKPPICRKVLTNLITQYCIGYTLSRAGLQLGEHANHYITDVVKQDMMQEQYVKYC
jgi:hypothetical protein